MMKYIYQKYIGPLSGGVGGTCLFHRKILIQKCALLPICTGLKKTNTEKITEMQAVTL